MDLNAIGQKNIEEISSGSLWFTKGTKEGDDTGSILEDVSSNYDSARATQLDSLKSEVKKAQEPGRAAYLEALKAAIADGDDLVSSDRLADALISDGFLEDLI